MNYFGMNFILTFACLISSTVLYREHDTFLVKERSIELLHMISDTQHMCTQHITINTAGHYKDTKAHTHISCIIIIRECGSTLYVEMAQGVLFSLYIGIGAKFENTQKTGERRLRTAEYRTVLL